MNDRTNIVVPLVAVGIAVLSLLMLCFAPPAKTTDLHLEQFGTLPCQANGRVKPLDTVARTYLMVVSGRQAWADEDGKEHPAIEWLADLFVSGPPFYDRKTATEMPLAYKHRVLRIESEQLLNMLELKPRQGFRYSLAELNQKPNFEELVEKTRKKKVSDYDDVDHQLKTLYDHVMIIEALSLRKVPSRDEDEPRDLGLIPPADPNDDSWVGLRSGQNQEKAVQFGLMLFHYKHGDADKFNSSLEDYKRDIDQARPAEASKARFETFFNNFAPLDWCMYAYLFVIVACCISWMTWTKPLNAAAFWVSVVIVCVHTFALIARMYIQGRPPVTNLYSSAIFIGWGCVGLCLFMEYLFKNGICNVAGAALGAATLFLAHYMAVEQGDTMEMLQAVLDTNFWLATHVVCVTLGYTATFVAGALGIAYIVMGVATPFLTRDWIKSLGQATYGVLCFATLLSFTGTVLGGIWADQSWGRFWGWDPKENGAVLIVIWNALILHARWAGLVKERGIAVMTVFGNIVVAWSYFGTNQLGVGLHAYGFNKHLATGCAIFWVTQLALIAAGSLPLKHWRSFSAAKYAPQPVKKPTMKPVSV
jgi:ABC-type transport system involved in cytochrome c biogenesis permease subunit